MKSKTYNQNKQPLDKTQSSKFCQLGFKRTVGGSWGRLPQRIVKNEFDVFENTLEIFTCNNQLLCLFRLLASILHLTAHIIEKASFV